MNTIQMRTSECACECHNPNPCTDWMHCQPCCHDTVNQITEVNLFNCSTKEHVINIIKELSDEEGGKYRHIMARLMDLREGDYNLSQDGTLLAVEIHNFLIVMHTYGQYTVYKTDKPSRNDIRREKIHKIFNREKS